jgi:hypothetical protein
MYIGLSKLNERDRENYFSDFFFRPCFDCAHYLVLTKYCWYLFKILNYFFINIFFKLYKYKVQLGISCVPNGEHGGERERQLKMSSIHT